MKAKIFCYVVVSLMFVLDSSCYANKNVKSNEYENSQEILIAASNVTYLRDVILYTYNMNWRRYDKSGTAKLYKTSSGQLFLNDGWGVHNNYDRNVPFNFWVVDGWGICYYFN